MRHEAGDSGKAELPRLGGEIGVFRAQLTADRALPHVIQQGHVEIVLPVDGDDFSLDGADIRVRSPFALCGARSELCHGARCIRRGERDGLHAFALGQSGQFADRAADGGRCFERPVHAEIGGDCVVPLGNLPGLGRSIPRFQADVSAAGSQLPDAPRQIRVRCMIGLEGGDQLVQSGRSRRQGLNVDVALDREGDGRMRHHAPRPLSVRRREPDCASASVTPPSLR